MPGVLRYRHVLVAYDGSPAAELALAHGVALAQSFHARLALVPGLPPPPPPPPPGRGGPPPPAPRGPSPPPPGGRWGRSPRPPRRWPGRHPGACASSTPPSRATWTSSCARRPTACPTTSRSPRG